MKVTKLMVLVAIATMFFTACSGTPKKLDIKRLTEMQAYTAEQMKESDYDFLIDQMEILLERASKLPKGQDLMSSLDKEEQEAAMFLGMAFSFIDKSVWTEAQSERLRKLEERYPGKLGQ